MDLETTRSCCTFIKKEKYVAATEDSKDMIWLQRFMEELGKKEEIVGYIVKSRVPFILKRTKPSILILNIYNSSTISYDQFWNKGS